MTKVFDATKFRKSITKSIQGLGIGFSDPTDWISTGNYALNYLMTSDFNKGIPLGKVTVLAGESGAGKSYIASGNIIKNAQDQGIFVILIDTENALDEAERAAIDTHGLHNLGDFRPKEPTDAEVKIIKELFEKSVDGEAYDLEQYGQYFRPAGMAYQAKPQVSVPTASAPVTEAAPTAAPVTESAPAPQPAAATAPAGDSAKRAEDILKLIRSRQAK